MAIDIQGSLNFAKTMADKALKDTGTRVSLGVPGETTAVDRATLAATTAPATTYGTDIPALIKDASQLRAAPYPAAEQVPVLQWEISMPVENSPERGHIVTVETCRDARLVGRRFIIDTVKTGSAGVLRQVMARLIPVHGKA